MNKSNIQTNKKQTKNVSLYATISVMVAFALIASPIVSTMNYVFAEVEVIEGGPIFIKGCKGGTAGEVPGQPGVCKEKSKSSESSKLMEIQYDGQRSSDKEYNSDLYWKTYNTISSALK
ncbi:MAG: hypothetical protein AB7U98_12135 [Candidatus Nitrosocosmicus sp.]